VRSRNLDRLIHHISILTLKDSWGSRNFLPWSRPTSLTDGDASCVGEFRTTFRTIPAFVAQWIEQRFPKPQVVGSIPTGGASNFPYSVFRKLGHAARSRAHATCID
jgi:hypothetical protein